MQKEPKILFVTSFNEEMYKATGKALVESFLQKIEYSEAKLYIAHEGFPFITNDNPKLYIHNVVDDWLLQILHDNKDVIPKYLGGSAEKCNCKNPYGKRDWDHKKGCYFTWWNRNFSRWLRKISAIRQAFAYNESELLSFDYLLWVDSDCVFRRDFRPENIFVHDASIIYMKGRFREAIESGIIGFKNNVTGSEAFKKVAQCYSTGEFRKFKRWDDGYIFTKILLEYPTLDLVRPNYKKPDVANASLFNKFIQHNKGTHGRGLGIMI